MAGDGRAATTAATNAFSYGGNLLRRQRRAQGKVAQAGVLRERHAPAAGLGWRLGDAPTSASATRMRGGEGMSVL
eukprot:COSAG06_NODE_691_length_13050_cov_5.757625_5_plen_75_part_00